MHVVVVVVVVVIAEQHWRFVLGTTLNISYI